MKEHVASVISLHGVTCHVGDYVTTMAAEFVAEELNMLLNTGEDGNFGSDTYGWLYDNVDFSDEISDPFSLEDMYRTTAEHMSIAVFEIRNMYEFESLKHYLLHNMAVIEDVDIEPRESTIVVNIDLIKE